MSINKPNSTHSNNKNRRGNYNHQTRPRNLTFNDCRANDVQHFNTNNYSFGVANHKPRVVAGPLKQMFGRVQLKKWENNGGAIGPSPSFRSLINKML